MPDKYYDPNDPALPTEPLRPASNQQPPYPGQGQQGKLVLGSFKDQQKQQQQKKQQRSQPQQTRAYFTPPAQPSQVPPTQPVQYNAQNYPYQPGAPSGASPASPATTPAASFAPRPKAKPKKRRGCGIGCLILLLILLGAGIFTFTSAQRVLAFGDTISNQPALSTQTGYMSGSERTNVLVIGYGGGSHEGAALTDSLLVASIMPQTKHTSLISIPRDLWVQVPEGSGNYGKINTVYQVGSNFGKDTVAGGDALARKVSAVTGLDVKYWVTIDFQGFRKLIDAIGGVDVYVPNGFSADYPKNDDPAVDASWITVKFEKGNQHMNGETAIRYARARYVTDNPAESTDYARSARQQIIVKAILAKVKETGTWPKLFDAMDAMKDAVFTNLSFADLSQFALKTDMNDPKTSRIGLNTTNVLEEDAEFNLHPRGGDWKVVADYIQQNLYK